MKKAVRIENRENGPVVAITDDFIKKERHDDIIKFIEATVAEKGGAFVTLNFSSVSRVDSLAMSFLVKLHLGLKKRNMRLVLENVAPGIIDVFRKTRLDANFHFAESI